MSIKKIITDHAQPNFMIGIGYVKPYCEKLEQENQKLKALLDLAMGDEGLNGALSGLNFSREYIFSRIRKRNREDGAAALVANCNLERARATQNEILKQLGEVNGTAY
jgi:hypothetical protein